jgi:hypothetical protein
MEFDFDPCSGALSSLIPEAAAFANQAIESSLKNQGPRNPYLAFNNFRALKCDFGSNICFCELTRCRASKSS